MTIPRALTARDEAVVIPPGGKGLAVHSTLLHSGQCFPRWAQGVCRGSRGSTRPRVNGIGLRLQRKGLAIIANWITII